MAVTTPIRYINHELTADNPMTVVRKLLPKAFPGCLQIHPHWEFGVVLGGLYGMLYTDRTAKLKAGGVWWNGPWQLHSYDIIKPRTELVVSEFYAPVIYSLPDLETMPIPIFLPFLRPGLRKQLENPGPQAREKIMELAKTMAEEVEKKQTGWKTKSRLILWEILTETVRGHTTSSYATPAQNSTPDRILTAIDFISKNLTGDITLAGAAEKASMSRTHFTRNFKQVTGMPFAQYVTKCRLDGARHDILHSDLKLEAIARQWGFYDAGHLQRLYLKFFGHTPKQARQKAA